MWFVLICAFAPKGFDGQLHHRVVTSSRLQPLNAPMVELTQNDMPILQVTLPQHAVADMAMRQAIYTFRILNGDVADALRDLRTLLTASTVGSVRSACGVGNAWIQRSPLLGLQQTSMLLHHSLQLSCMASRFVPGVSSLGAVPLAMSLWLIWIATSACIWIQRLAGGGGEERRERRVLQLRLCKLLLDVPIAVHFLLSGSLLPLSLLGLLGIASSWLGIRAAVIDPAKPRAPTVKFPMPLIALRQLSPLLRMRWCAPARSFCRCQQTSMGENFRSSKVCMIPRSPACRHDRLKHNSRLIPLSKSCRW